MWRFPTPVNEALVASCILRMLLPKMYGGGEIEPGTYLRAITALAQGDGSVAWNVFVANSAALIAPYLPEASARLIFDDPVALIAWGPPNGQGAKAVAGGYLVNARWDFPNGWRQATWMGVHGPFFEADGATRLIAQGKPLIRTWLFPLDQAERHDVWNPIGLRGTASDTYIVRDVFVPEAFSPPANIQKNGRYPGLYMP